MTLETMSSDKSQLITSAQQKDATERPPANDGKPFVAKFVKWAIRTQDFVKKDRATQAPIVDAEGKPVMETHKYLRMYWDPQDAVAPWEDGLYYTEWDMSDSKQSKYGAIIHHLDDAIAAATGNPGAKFTDPDELVGMAFLIGQVDAKHSFWDISYRNEKGVLTPHVRKENRERMTRSDIVVLGPAPVGWEKNVPGNIAELKMAAMTRAAARKADREAGSGGGSSSGASTIPSFTEAPKANLTGIESVLVQFLDGREEESNIVLAAVNSEALKDAVGDAHQDVVFGLGNGSVQAALVAQGLLTVTDGTYRAA